jgi:ABC-type polysaccharide/polyol phosphate transport system ATPase subunit
MLDVRFNHVSKIYRVTQPGQGRSWRRVFSSGAQTDFWALRDVSFEVGRGEALGIIGHNGAGKSTILKLLSRITAPSAGEIVLHGRVSALIEVGSGFHPELSGRENVFLSGAILGMKRREIAEKFDRIVDFSGVGGFIDTPVKWYSSGMYVRLGFAIAAHLEPDILLVDEVLAVGDAAFQVQCQERLNELRHSGITMMFISHDLMSVEKLCDRVMLMDRGRLVASGQPHEIIEDYLRVSAAGHVAEQADAMESRPGTAVIESIAFHDAAGTEVISARTGAPLVTRVHFNAEYPVPDAVLEVFYYSRDGRTLHCQQSTALSDRPLHLAAGRGVLEFVWPEVALQPGVYSIGGTIRQRHASDTIDWFYGRTLLYVEAGKSVRGYFYTPHDWRLMAPKEAHAPAAMATHAAADDRRSHV